VTDPLGGVTQYQYDGVGNLTQQTDALGHTTTYTYDANGNRLTESKTQTTGTGTRSVVTQYQYDGANRLTQTTFIQRVNTRGGIAPAASTCTAAAAGTQQEVPYTADYFFWRKTV